LQNSCELAKVSFPSFKNLPHVPHLPPKYPHLTSHYQPLTTKAFNEISLFAKKIAKAKKLLGSG